MAKSRKTNGEGEPAVVDETPIVRGNVNRQVARAESFVSFYANDVQLQTTPWDVRLTFSEMYVDPPSNHDGPTAHISQLGQVRLSPPLAKRVMIILAQQVRAYEEKFGAIPQPPDED